MNRSVPRFTEHDRHYHFSHRALRDFAFANPVKVFAMLAGPERKPLCKRLLRSFPVHPPIDVGRSLAYSDMGFSKSIINGRPCWIVQMPQPERGSEAFFVAIWSRATTTEMERPMRGWLWWMQCGIDYLTLEQPASPVDGIETFFCGWVCPGSHRLYGPGPLPNLPAFREALEEWDREHAHRLNRRSLWQRVRGLRYD